MVSVCVSQVRNRDFVFCSQPAALLVYVPLEGRLLEAAWSCQGRRMYLSVKRRAFFLEMGGPILNLNSNRNIIFIDHRTLLVILDV